jgi:hypothetical protein
MDDDLKDIQGLLDGAAHQPEPRTCKTVIPLVAGVYKEICRTFSIDKIKR